MAAKSHPNPVVGSSAGDARREDLSVIEKSRRERHRALIFPREHGAWGLLLVPMVTGAGVAARESRNFFPFVLLLTAALSLFWLRTPLESLLGISAIRAETGEERRDVAFVVAYLGAVALLSLSMLLWAGDHPILWLIGVAAGLAFIGQALLKKAGRRFRTLSEIVGTIGLTSSAAAAYYVITGNFGPIGWALWLANLIFAGNQIHYVQIRIHSARLTGIRAKLSRRLGICRRTVGHDGRSGWRLPCGIHALDCLDRLHATVGTRLVLLRAEAHSPARQAVRMGRTGAGCGVLCSFHSNIFFRTIAAVLRSLTTAQ
jgi:hypothetical protein